MENTAIVCSWFSTVPRNVAVSLGWMLKRCTGVDKTSVENYNALCHMLMLRHIEPYNSEHKVTCALLYYLSVCDNSLLSCATYVVIWLSFAILVTVITSCNCAAVCQFWIEYTTIILGIISIGSLPDTKKPPVTYTVCTQDPNIRFHSKFTGDTCCRVGDEEWWYT